jgi:hypothetical protein
VRDVTFNEDRPRIRVGNGPAMIACLRNIAIALARLLGFTNIASALRAFAQHNRAGLSPRSASNAQSSASSSRRCAALRSLAWRQITAIRLVCRRS